MTLHIGFTGTRHGMTVAQGATVNGLLAYLGSSGIHIAIRQRDAAHAHSGDCVGADAEFHALCVAHGLWTVGHPPVDQHHRAHCQYDEVREPLTHFARNRAIVDESTVMFATPHEAHHQTRGGTWYTIDYANKIGKPLLLVLPDGSVSPNAEYMTWLRESSPA